MNRRSSVSVPFAHLGHWYVQLAFAVPSLLIIGVIGRDSIRRRWRERRGRGRGKGDVAPRKKPR